MLKSYPPGPPIGTPENEEAVGHLRAQVLAELAIGRIFRLGSRPTEIGDVEEYERLRAIIMDAAPNPTDHKPNYVRDRLKGAAGD